MDHKSESPSRLDELVDLFTRIAADQRDYAERREESDYHSAKICRFGALVLEGGIQLIQERRETVPQVELFDDLLAYFAKGKDDAIDLWHDDEGMSVPVIDDALDAVRRRHPNKPIPYYAVPPTPILDPVAGHGEVPRAGRGWEARILRLGEIINPPEGFIVHLGGLRLRVPGPAVYGAAGLLIGILAIFVL